ncbi:MAG: AbrB/MazE/SpoVT family DNA-binding domain-containing protein [bacterium]
MSQSSLPIGTIVRLKAKGQVVLPAGVRKRLHLEEDTELNVLIQDGLIILQPLLNTMGDKLLQEPATTPYLTNTVMRSEKPSALENLLKLAGTVESEPDLAAEHDQYLYGENE